MNTEIIPVFPEELEKARKLLTEIRMDCLVKMYDVAQVSSQRGNFFITPSKPLPSQYFSYFFTLTLELIKYGDEQEIGRIIKDAYRKLEEHIVNYELHRS
jgi:hypothetical protein